MRIALHVAKTRDSSPPAALLRQHWGLNNFLDEDFERRVERSYGDDYRKHLAVREQMVAGKPNKFRLARALRKGLTVPDPTRYYRIRENTMGGYLTRENNGWIRRDSRRIDNQRRQMFRFIHVGEGWYRISSGDPNKVWTVTWSGLPFSDLHGIRMAAPDGDKSVFKLTRVTYGNDAHAFRIDEKTKNEVLGIGRDLLRWDGRLVRWRANDPKTQRYWLEDAGPVNE